MRSVRTVQGERQAEAPRPPRRPLALLEEGDRPARARRADRAVRGRGGGGLADGDPQDKADQPGRRFGTYQLREELTGDEPTKRLTEGKKRSSGRNAAGRVTARHRGGGAKRRYRQIDFKRTKDGVPAKVATIEYDPNRERLHRAAQLRRRREALHPRPAGAAGRRRGRVRRGRRHHPRQRPAAEPDPDGHRRPQRRAGPRPGRPPRPRRRQRDPGRREGGPDGQPAAALLGGPDGPRRVPRDRRLALQRRAPERQDRQGRAQPPQGQAARRPAASR